MQTTSVVSSLNHFLSKETTPMIIKAFTNKIDHLFPPTSEINTCMYATALT